MASMGKLLSTGIGLEPSGEEAARERVAMMAIQKEMSEADEVNLLEEEDMHVFDQQPLSDRFSLVSCNTCKKPIKASQYSAHAERCGAHIMFDDVVADKKPFRTTQTNFGDGNEDSELQVMGGFASSKVGKRTMNGAETKAGRARRMTIASLKVDGNGAGPSNSVQTEAATTAKRRKQPLPCTIEELDVVCGVPSPRSGFPCRQPLTCKSHSISSKRAVVGRRKPFDALLQEYKENLSRETHQDDVPRPIATKIYRLRQHQRMRNVISCMYQESATKSTGVIATAPTHSNSSDNSQHNVFISLRKGLHQQQQ